MFEKLSLILGVISHLSSFSASFIGRSINASLNNIRFRYSKVLQIPDSEKRNIIIIGGSFAGYYAARYIASALTPNSLFRVIVIEPRSHFNFTWVLPRFCVVEGHEHKAFIPLTGLTASMPPGKLIWMQDRVVEVNTKSVHLQSGEEIPYEFLIVATGSGASVGLPSRLDANDKPAAIEELKNFQQRIKASTSLVVVGGGAAGVELATDAKSQYPEKSVTLVHSRSAVMHKFSTGLQERALKSIKDLGVEVILGERVVDEKPEQGVVTLKSGRQIQCDCIINCTGQIPTSNIISQLSPSSISDGGYIRVKPTMQIIDDNLPNIYACGDVADTNVANTNARSAFCQALVVVDNVLLAIKGQSPKYNYKPHWVDASIKLTLGLNATVAHISDGITDMTFSIPKGNIALDSHAAWKGLGAKPFKDPVYDNDEISSAAALSKP